MKKMTLAVATTLCAVAGQQASAITLESFDSSTVSAFTSGSTAYDTMLRAYMRYVCSDGVNEYRANVTQPTAGVYTSTSILQSGYMCTLKNVSTVVTDANLRGKKVLVRKSSGDSGEGVVVGTGALTINFFADPVVTNSSVTNSVSNYTCAAGSSSAAAGVLGSIQQWSCTGVTAGAATTGAAGFADVEFSLLNQVITPKSTAASLSTNLQNYPIAANVWGIVVSKNLRDALQTAEGLTAGDDSEAGMPSIPPALVASILTGTITDWSALQNASGTALFSSPTTIYLARRPDSSGTQQSINATFLNKPCVGADTAMLGDNTGGVCGTAVAAGNVSVTVGQGTGNLLSCLTTLNGSTKYGIGFASTTNNPISAIDRTISVTHPAATQTDAGWRYIKIGGFAPTLLNASIGAYPYVTEGALGYQKSGATLPTGLAKNLIDELGTQLGQPNVLAAVNVAATQDSINNGTPPAPFYTGVMTSAANVNYLPTYPMTVANVNANPTLALTRAINGLNACQPLQNFSNPQQIGPNF
jgi:hypothetical protein